jgi:hypothetical protein
MRKRMLQMLNYWKYTVSLTRMHEPISKCTRRYYTHIKTFVILFIFLSLIPHHTARSSVKIYTVSDVQHAIAEKSALRAQIMKVLK